MTLEFISSKYRVLGKKGEGTFSEVLKCQNVKDGTYRACKKMKQHYERNQHILDLNFVKKRIHPKFKGFIWNPAFLNPGAKRRDLKMQDSSIEQVNNLREIQAMRRLSPHPNILELQEVLFDKKSGTLVLVCELMDMNIYELIRGRRHYVPEKKIKLYMYQLLRSIDHMHRNGIFHRDVKPENILIKEDLLKLADFGSCRSVYSKQPYTEYISTRWYRAPECLLTDGYYTYKMDIWSVGCVFFEIMSLHPLFPGSNEVDQIAKIHDIMGTPDISVLNKLRNKTRGMNFNFPTKKGSGIEKLLPHASHDCIDLIYQMCSYDPDERIAAKQAIRHPYFKELRESDKRAAALEKQRQQHLKEQQEREKEKEKKDKEESGEKEKEKTKKISDAKDSDQVSVIRSSRPPSGGSTVVARYPASILHGRDPIYSYHRKERRKRRQRQRMSESGPSPNGSSLLPKVNQAKPSTFQPTFHSTSYSGAATLPKLAGGTAASSNSTATMLPSLTNAFVKPAPKPKVSMYRMNGSSYPTFGTAKSSATTTLMPTFTNTFVKPAPKAKMGGVKGQRVYLEKYTHQAQPQATKNMYGHYQLPSIDRRGAGY